MVQDATLKLERIDDVHGHDGFSVAVLYQHCPRMINDVSCFPSVSVIRL